MCIVASLRALGDGLRRGEGPRGLWPGGVQPLAVGLLREGRRVPGSPRLARPAPAHERPKGVALGPAGAGLGPGGLLASNFFFNPAQLRL